MTRDDGTIHHVSDTALWVAYYRAQESERPDALFHDPYAKVLVGDRGEQIAKKMQATSQYTRWILAIRTYIIDQFIQKLVAEGVETVLNLGAGLDTRPYRMQLPASLHWVEVDYPHMIDHKEKVLAAEKSRCQLERVRLDLADRGIRREFLANIASKSKKVLVLTEGVLPYLTEAQVTDLGKDLYDHEVFQFWIAEYFSPQSAAYLKDPKRMRQMRNAPFLFFPEDWFKFFKDMGWVQREIKYLGEESVKLNRKIPGPWWVFIFKLFLNKEQAQKHLQMMGYVLFRRCD